MHKLTLTLIGLQAQALTRFAIPSNRFTVLKTSTGPNQTVKTHLAFERCVSCYKPNLDLNKPSEIPMDTRSYFCCSCHKKIDALKIDYHKLGPIAAAHFDEQCAHHFFKPRS